MTQHSSETVINVTAVIVAVTDEMPRVLVVHQSDTQLALPKGPFEPARDTSLESGLRRLVEEQTGLDLYYVEQLYTFGNRYRDPAEFDGGPRVVSVAYIALTHEGDVAEENAEWMDWYSFLPWEDWRDGRPGILSDRIETGLARWSKQLRSPERRKAAKERINVTFGQSSTSEMDAVLTLERFELLYEAELVAESVRDRKAADRNYQKPDGELDAALPGHAMASDDRRILATALGRLRGKLAYRPVVFELLPGEFTLLQLQRVAEALSGAKLHKQNFRRLVANADLVEAVGRTAVVGRGRPAELFRFRREVLGEKLTVGLARPIMRSQDG